MRAIGRRTVMKGFLGAGAGTVIPGWASAASSPRDLRPWTIPALREWLPAPGVFRLGTRPRIVVSPHDASRLRGDAEVLAEDLGALLDGPVEVLIRAGGASDGDCVLRIGEPDTRIGDQGYVLDLGPSAVLTAPTSTGVFHGTRSLLQLLRQGREVPAGRAVDWPRHAERGLMIDIGRKPFSLDWLRERVHEMAHLKLNLLHLHINEDLGWRIESALGLHSADHLTKAQVTELVTLAARHHITVVPEIDLPGHMGWALRGEYAKFRLRSPATEKDNALDYTRADARRFVHDLIDEYLPLFPGPFWHTGADEFLTTFEQPLYPQLAKYGGGDVKDGFLSFVNEINDHVRGAGKTLRAWNDALAGGRRTTLDPDIVVEWWTDVSPLGDLFLVPKPQELLDDGHRVLNAGWFPTYYTNLPTPIPVRPQPREMYEGWQVHQFRGPAYLNGDIAPPYHEVAPDAPVGTTLHVWNDDPTRETPEQIAAGIHDRLRVLAQQAWRSPHLTGTYDEFRRVIDAVGPAPRRP